MQVSDHREVQHERSDDAGQFGSTWQIWTATSEPGWAVVVEPFKHFHCASTHPRFFLLELQAPVLVSNDAGQLDSTWTATLEQLDSCTECNHPPSIFLA